jgi:galactose mutarotase-like enzyme
MSCVYQVETDDFGIYDVLQNEAIGVRTRIRRHGAEMVSLARHDAAGNWRGFLYRDNETGPPASGWGNHATVMGYYLHRLLGGRTLYRGVELRGGNHGFLRSFDFEAPTFDPSLSALTYQVPADRIPEGAYPLRVSLTLIYRLLPDGVRVEFVFANEETELAAHVSFGLHPGFALSSLANAEVLLPEGVYRRLWAPGNFLDGRVDEVAHAGGPMPFDKAALLGSYLLGLSGVPSRLITLRDSESGTSVVLDFSEAPYCTLWSESEAMICIEPCWGLPDSDPQKPFESKDGIQEIPPLASLSAGFSIHTSLNET